MDWCIRTLALLVLSSYSFSYPTPVDFSGKLSRWSTDKGDDPITFEITGDRDADVIFYEDVIIEAAEMWGDVTSSYFAYEQIFAGKGAQVTVHLDRDFEDGGVSAGFADFDESDEEGPIHCSIFIGMPGGGTLSVGKTALHELGHCLGLGHSLIPEAIMSYSNESNAFGLDTDDMAAVSRLYPADGSKPELPPGCGIAKPQQKGNFILILIFILTPFLFSFFHNRNCARKKTCRERKSPPATNPCI